MKYTKKVPYFKKGDKIDKAARKLPKKQKEAVLKVSSAQKEQERKDKLSSVGAGFRKPTARVVATTRSQRVGRPSVGNVTPIEGNRPKVPTQRIEIPTQNVRRVVVGNTGKTREEIMAEAYSNQKEQKEFEEQERKNRLNSVGAGFRMPTATVIMPVDTRSAQIENTVGRPVVKPRAKTLDQAFQEARERGDSEFIWEGETYHTRTAEEEEEARRKAETPVPEQRRTDTEQHSKDVQNLPNISRWKSLLWNLFGWNPGTESVDTGWTSHGERKPIMTNRFVTKDGKDVSYLSIDNFNKPLVTRIINEGDTTYTKHGDAITRYHEILDDGDIEIRKARGFQQGGIINKFQQGDKLHLRNTWERMFGITPDYIPVNSQESITSYMDNTHKGPVEKRVIRKEVPYADLYSTMSIRNPRTNRADTTFTAPSGTKYDMNDVRSGKAPSGYGYKFFRKPAGYFQQGGEVQQQPQMTEEDLITDFTVRYLSALGVAPEDIMDQEGNLNPVYVEEITNVFQQGDIDWESYVASPDEYIQQFVGSKMQMAKKGAKLKRLSQLRIYKK